MAIFSKEQIVDFIKANPNKYTYNELGNRFECNNDRLYHITKCFAIKHLVNNNFSHRQPINKYNKIRCEVTNPLFYVKNRPGYQEKEEKAIEMIKNGDNLTKVASYLEFHYQTITNIVKEFKLQKYILVENQKVLNKLKRILSSKPNVYTAPELAKMVSSKIYRLSKLITENNFKDLVKKQWTLKREQQTALLESIEYTSTLDLIIKAKTLKISDTLIAQKLDVTKQNINIIKLNYQRGITNSKPPSSNPPVPN